MELQETTQQFKLIELLTEIGEKCNQISDYTLNSGGCGVYAALLARKLSEYNVISNIFIRVIMFSEEDAEFEDITLDIDDYRPSNMDEWRELGVAFDHVVIEFEYNKEQYICDSDGVQLLKDLDYDDEKGYNYIDCCSFNNNIILPGTLSIDEIEYYALSGAKGNSWNNTFYSDCIEEIEDIINSTQFC